MKSDPTWLFILFGALGGVLLVKHLWFPQRCPRCGSRTYTQHNDISQHTIQRCGKCGSMNDLGETPKDQNDW